MIFGRGFTGTNARQILAQESSPIDVDDAAQVFAYDAGMPTLLELDPPLDDIIEAEVASGRFATASDVVRTALSLLKRQQLLDERLEQSLAEVKAGATTDMNVVFDELDRELQEIAALRA